MLNVPAAGGVLGAGSVDQNWCPNGVKLFIGWLNITKYHPCLLANCMFSKCAKIEECLTLGPVTLQ